jgi:ubiquitin C-terminal hydrolase
MRSAGIGAGPDILPFGLSNPGNFCYINSCIQCLKHIKPINNLVNANTDLDEYIAEIFNLLGITIVINPATMKQKTDMVFAVLSTETEMDANQLAIKAKVDKIIADQGSTIDEFILLLKKISTHSSKVYLYVGLRNLLYRLNTGPKHGEIGGSVDATQFYNLCAFATRDTGMAHIVDGGQNDAVEFLMCLLDYLHDSHSMPIDMDIPEAILKMTEAELEKETISKRIRYGLLRDIHSRYSKSYTSFNRELYFYNLSIVKCGKCAHISLNYSPYNILCLPLNDTAGLTIYDCMDKMFSREVLDCGYKCEKCTNTADNTIEKKILTLPQTLIICLKRFDYKVLPNGVGVPIKINSMVTYPKVLDISKYYPSDVPSDSPACNKNIYTLIGVVNHAGHSNFGHYYSYCYDAGKDYWISYNDSRVSTIPEPAVLVNPNAYILFYQRIV